MILEFKFDFTVGVVFKDERPGLFNNLHSSIVFKIKTSEDEEYVKSIITMKACTMEYPNVRYLLLYLKNEAKIIDEFFTEIPTR